MKKYILSIVMACLLFQTETNGQSTDRIYKYHVGVNALGSFWKFLSKNKIDTAAENIVPASIYIGRSGKKMSYRVGLSWSNSQSITESYLFTDSRTASLQQYRAFLSVYRNRQILPKVHLQYGLNFTGMLFNDDQISNSGFDKINVYKHYKGIGGGPGAVIAYQISPRLTVFTEYVAMFQYIYGKEGKDFTAFPSANYKVEGVDKFVWQGEYPLAVYVQYHF